MKNISFQFFNRGKIWKEVFLIVIFDILIFELVQEKIRNFTKNR